jgi:hypothetical protein
MASPSAISPTTWAVKTGVSADTGDASDTGALFPVVGCAAAVEPGLLAPCNGLIVGNRPAALPAPIRLAAPFRLASPFRSGTGPSGTTSPGVAPAVALAGLVALLADAVTAVVSAAAGGVHFAVVVTPAVAVSFTEVTEVAFDATAIWASMLTVLLVVTEPMLHEVPSPLAQPLLKVGF